MLPPEELPILEALVYIKHRLTALKKDTTTFIRAKDVMSIYQQVTKEVNKLNVIRDRQAQDSMISGSSAITNDEANVPPPSRSRRTSSASRTYRPGNDDDTVTIPAHNPALPDDSTGGDDGGVSTNPSSRAMSPNSTPFEERNHHLDRFLQGGGASARSSPAVTPQLPSSESQVEQSTIDEVASQLDQQHLSQIDVKPPTEINRVDQVLNDVFGLLGLFFLTIGKVKESPSVFCQIASIRQILDHMYESGVYTQQDLQPFAQRLTVLKSIIKKDKEEDKHPSGVLKIMWRKWEDCERLLQTLLKSLSVLSVELVPIHQRLVYIRRKLSALAASLKPEKKELKPLVEELRKIDCSRVDGKFLGPGGTSVPAGQAILVGLMEECFEIVQDIRAREGADSMPPPLKPVWERLTEIRAQLERLQLTHRWTLRETDLYNYAQALREVDRMRVDGVFVDSDGNKAEGQYVLLYLLRRCHGLIFRLIAESQPISEELMPIANKLITISTCLNEVMKYGGPYSARDLYPYHLALHQIDSLRQDGKFLSEDGSVPEGQAILIAQLNEAHELLEMLKNNDEDEDDDDNDDDEAEDDDEDDEVVNLQMSKAAPLDLTPRQKEVSNDEDPPTHPPHMHRD